MSKRPAYAILGKGYWAERMRTVLAEEHSVTCIGGTRRRGDESLREYQARLAESLRATDAQVAWICVPPGAHVRAMVETGLTVGMHVIAEKPWLNSRDETEALKAIAVRRGLILGVHYEYCLLEGIEAWRREFKEDEGLEFGGRFNISRTDKLDLDALDNLGTHLLAIQNYAVPQARVGLVGCGYQRTDERKVWLEKERKRVAAVDFLGSREPIIQRFVERVEKAIEGAEFPFDLEFGLRVAENIRQLKLRTD